MVTVPDLLRVRLSSQLLTTPSDGDVGTVAEAARHMLAVQGQDPVAAQWALGIRAPGSHVSDVYAAQERGDVVRSWPMRSTVHLVPAEDIGWMQKLLTPRVAADAPRRREQLQLPLDTVERMREIAVERLTGGKRMTRAELIATFEDEGITMLTGWSYHCIWWLCQTGTLTFGPPVGPREAALVLLDEWVPTPIRLDGDEALAELGARYLAGHGPATPIDLAWWTKLSLSSARAALALARDAGRAESHDVDGATWWTAPGAFDRPREALPGVQLLPAFDELLLGYRDRSLSADAAHTRLLMTVNGIAQPTVMLDGRAVGTWKLASGRVAVSPFDDVRQPGPRPLADAVAAVEDFYSTPAPA